MYFFNGRVEWNLEEGVYFEPIKEIARVYGKSCDILLGERTALNILARCSGIATRYTSYLLRKKVTLYNIIDHLFCIGVRDVLN